jgi:hypothetical protein
MKRALELAAFVVAVVVMSLYLSLYQEDERFANDSRECELRQQMIADCLASHGWLFSAGGLLGRHF